MIKKLLFLLSISVATCLAESDVNVLPLTGPIGSVKISPANGSATGYRMDYPGQKAICFQSNSAVIVYIGSSTVNTTSGYPLLSSGANICMDLKGGTTLYFYGAGASSDVRAIFSR